MVKYLLLLAIIIISSCKEDEKNCDEIDGGYVVISYCESKEKISNVPYIENVKLSRNQINQQDSITIKFEFKDGDGDLGDEDVLSSSGCSLCDVNCFDSLAGSFLILNDDRVNCVIPYIISDDFPKQNISLSGEVDVIVQLNCCIPPTGSWYPCIPSTQYPNDTVVYTIRIKDRAGNWSNALQTPPLYISCN